MKGITHVHREPETASGTLLLKEPPAVVEKTSGHIINLEETHTSNLPPCRDRDPLSAATCPFAAAHHPFPFPVGTPLPFLNLVVRVGIQLTAAGPMGAVSGRSVD